MEAPNEGLCKWICMCSILNCLECCDDFHSNERCVTSLCREVWPHSRFPVLSILPWIEDAPPAVSLTRCTSSPLMRTKFYNSDRYSNLNLYVTAYNEKDDDDNMIHLT